MRLSFLSLSPPSSCSFHCFFIYLQGYLPNKLKTLMLLELLVTFTNIYGQMTHSSSTMGLQSLIFKFLNRKKKWKYLSGKNLAIKKLRNILFPVAIIWPIYPLYTWKKNPYSCLVCVFQVTTLLSKMLFMVKIMLCTKC